ncbi:MAG TPA: PVC-type heme-binding CxxCH protein, partial [Chthoniobacteraceae bacterium]|nr:PVC-type heme-binding CxxCH protein [Chthoniobacteraceae bacterium]
MKVIAALAATVLAGTLISRAQTAPGDAPATFAFGKGLRLELVAAEPLVASPCALAFDARGRMFVAENRGYPRNAQPPIGTIALLEDTDQDGRMDKRTVFADGLTFPNGVLPWKNGLFVTCAPDVFYFEDTDGDGRADVRRVVLTGFATTGSTQLRVNAPIVGPDGWIWLASGLSGGNITAPDHPEFPPLALKSDLRFDPETGAFEAVDGRSQYGHSFDQAGRRFICMNRIQVQHVVLPSRYLQRNPKLAFSETVQNCPELIPNPLLRGGAGAARIFPISNNVTTADSHAGTFSAACSVFIWRDGALPDAYNGCAFSCDPTGNLVHVDKLEPRGATFSAVPLLANHEFLASRDDWFRPVFLARGPDGALYIADMYRKVIEHPDYLPEEIRKRTDFESGRDMGRIWRVTTAAARAEKMKANVSSGANRLRQLALAKTLTHETIADAFRDKDPAVREVALQLAEPLLAKAPSLLDRAMPLAEDENARVRFQFALSVGGVDEERVAQALGRIARRDHADRWSKAAAMSGKMTHLAKFLEGAIGAHLESDLLDLLIACGRFLPNETPDQIIAGLGEAIHTSADSAETIVAAILTGNSEMHGTVLDDRWSQLPALARKEIAILTAETEDARRRELAVRFLARTNLPESATALRALVRNEPGDAIAFVALRSMREADAAALLPELLTEKYWQSLPPRARESLLGFTMTRPAFMQQLLGAIESGKFPRQGIDAMRREQLLKSKTADIQKRAETIFGQPIPGDRRAAFESARAALQLSASGKHGRAVFQRSCAICHRLDREGSAVGPDLFDVRNQPKESILLHIIVPDHEIAPAFAAYHV